MRSQSTRRGKGRKCAECGRDFVPHNYRQTSKFCSRECGWTAQKREAEASRPPRAELVQLREVEGLAFGAIGRRYGKSAQWASLACRALGVRDPRRPTGKTVACVVCGAEFYARPSEIARGKRFCSHACQGKGMPSPSKRPEVAAKIAKGKLGPLNPAYKDGLNKVNVYRRYFNVRLKGDVCCRVCGATGLLHLHHAIPRSMFRDGIKELRNGIALCPPCHHGWHHRSVTVYRDVFTSDEWAYLTSVQLLGQDVRAWLDDRYPARPAENLG